MRCYLCGAAGRTQLGSLPDPAGAVEGRWSFVRCAACDLIWLDPPLAAGRFEDAYHGAYYTHGSGGSAAAPGWATPVLARRHGYAVRRGGRHSAAHALASRFGVVADAASALVRYLDARSGGRLLDVGCGNGDFLLLMQRLGWDVAGVDPDESAIAAAPAGIRGALRVGTLDSAAAGLGSFDAITLHHVVEHLDDPIRTLRSCRALLRPGGRAVVMTPNAAALGRRIFGRAWLHRDPPRHAFIFTRTSLGEVARRAGLRVERVHTTARAARWSWREGRRLQRAERAVPAAAGQARGAGAIAFQFIEHTMLRFGDFGEELVLAAAADGSVRN